VGADAGQEHERRDASGIERARQLRDARRRRQRRFPERRRRAHPRAVALEHAPELGGAAGFEGDDVEPGQRAVGQAIGLLVAHDAGSGGGSAATRGATIARTSSTNARHAWRPRTDSSSRAPRAPASRPPGLGRAEEGRAA
jgi:hypothetical protein